MTAGLAEGAKIRGIGIGSIEVLFSCAYMLEAAVVIAIVEEIVF